MVVENDTHCPLCSNASFKKVQQSGRFIIKECRKCSLIYTTPFPTQMELKTLYGREYFKPYVESDSEKQSIFNKRIKWLQQHVSSGKILDIGCETGIFLEIMRGRGWEIYGAEFSEIACNYAKERLGKTVFCGEVKDAHFADDTFDVVTLWHTLEHLTNPLEVLHESRRILRPGGMLFIEVPNIRFIRNYILNMLGIKKYFFFKEHVIHFSQTTLAAAVKAAGFAIIEITAGDVTDPEKDWKAFLNSIFVNLGLCIYRLTGLNVAHSIKIAAVKNDTIRSLS